MTKIPSVEVVVARYGEDVSWVDQCGYPAVIYNKGETPVPGAIPLPNIGRESHTYLTHIVSRYESLADTTVFLQGDPFFHLCEDGLADVSDLRLKIDDALYRKTPFQGLAWFKLKCDGLGRPHDMGDPSKQGKWKGWGKDIPVAETFERIFAATAPASFLARGVTGNFLVRRERVLTRPKGFYAYCLEVIENDPYDEMNTGHAFERLWHLLFNGNTTWNPPDGNVSKED